MGGGLRWGWGGGEEAEMRGRVEVQKRSLSRFTLLVKW